MRTAGAFPIDVGLPQHKARYVFAQCREDVRSLAQTVHDPDVFIKVIQTHEDQRRRGLGRVVMLALRRSASDQGADHGLLVATPDGRRLYATLGWQMHSLYTTAAIGRDDAASRPAVLSQS